MSTNCCSARLLKSNGRVAAGYYTQAFNFMMRPVIC
jgi:hypothetical protein